MLDCRQCKVTKKECEFKYDIYKALNIIDEYVPSEVTKKIENLIQDAIGTCDDYEGLENKEEICR